MMNVTDKCHSENVCGPGAVLSPGPLSSQLNRHKKIQQQCHHTTAPCSVPSGPIRATAESLRSPADPQQSRGCVCFPSRHSGSGQSSLPSIPRHSYHTILRGWYTVIHRHNLLPCHSEKTNQTSIYIASFSADIKIKSLTAIMSLE